MLLVAREVPNSINQYFLLLPFFQKLYNVHRCELTFLLIFSLYEKIPLFQLQTCIKLPFVPLYCGCCKILLII